MPDINLLLDVVEKAEMQDAYMIPPLLALAKRPGEEMGEHAKGLLAAFKPEALAPYRLWATRE